MSVKCGIHDGLFKAKNEAFRGHVTEFLNKTGNGQCVIYKARYPFKI